MPQVKIKTKFGNATLCNDGYYHITSRKEGNNGKKVSRLVFEDFYNIELPTDVHIHHVDGDRTNDNIWNLIPISSSEHSILHNKGISKNISTKSKISKNKTSTGFFRVIRSKAIENTTGYTWVYRVQNRSSDVFINSSSLIILKQRVTSQGLDWFIVDEELAEKSKQLEIDYWNIRKQNNNSGIHNVYKHNDNTCKQGFTWQYQYTDETSKKKIMSNVNLDDLKERVLNKGFDWIVFDDMITKVDAL